MSEANTPSTTPSPASIPLVEAEAQSPAIEAKTTAPAGEKELVAMAVATVPSTASPSPADLLASAKTPEEKLFAFVGFLFDRLLGGISTDTSSERAANLDLKRTTMRNEMIKWGVHRALLVGFILLLVFGIVMAWRAGDRDLAKDIIKYIIGGAAGWGIKAGVSSATAKE